MAMPYKLPKKAPKRTKPRGISKAKRDLLPLYAPNAKILQVLACYAPLYDPNYTYKILLGGRAAGRSVAAAQAVVHFSSQATMRTCFFREFQNSISESCKAQVEAIIDDLGCADDWIKLRSSTIHKYTRSVILYMGMARNYTKIKSLTNIDLAIVEECETVSRESTETLIPTITRNAAAELWFLGNPKDRTSAVAQIFIENEAPPKTVVIRSTYLDNPYVSQELIEGAEHMKRVDIASYNHIYMGQYLDKGNLRMVPYVTVDDGNVLVSDSDATVIGVDIAREGDDACAICVRKGRKMLKLDTYSDMDLPKLTSILSNLIRTYHPDRVNVDSTGHGAWAPDALRSTGVIVCGVNFGEKATRDDRYTNRRTELYGLAKEYFEGGGTIMRNQPLLQEELESTWYDLDNKNRFALESKSVIKKKIGRSPDCFSGSTMVITPDGEKCMVALSPSDRVLTPFGFRKVIFIASDHKKIISIESETKYIECTPDHEIFTFNNGWVKAGTLCAKDALSSNSSMNKAALMLLCGTEGSGGFKRQVDTTLQEEQELLSTMGSSCFTGAFGLRNTALYLMGMLFTILMATGRITASITSSVWSALSTVGIICLRSSRTLCTEQTGSRTLRRPKRLLKSGMLLMQGLIGTVLTRKTPSSRPLSAGALCAPRAVSPSSMCSIGCAQNVSPVFRKLRRKRCLSTARDTGRSSSVLSILVRCAVRQFATVSLGHHATVRDVREEAKVYCPTLADVNAFYANGVLVANCADACCLSLYNPAGGIFAKAQNPQAVSNDSRLLTISMLNAGSFHGKYT